VTLESPPQNNPLGPVAAERVSDQIADRLAAAIREGRFKPGERLPSEQELAELFQVGRTSVREGLQKLRALGLIRSRKGLGAFVAVDPPTDPLSEFARWTQSDPRAIEDLVETRFALEAFAAQLAALRATAAQLQEIESHHREHVRAGEKGDLAVVVASDEAFHEAIMAASGNRLLGRIYALLIPELTDFRQKTLVLPWAAARSAKGHARILAAIAERDSAGAKRAMVEHLFVLYEEVRASASSGGRGEQPVPLSRAALL
jgi:GntR family transcriptional repressor for pyruvate dehydrogenase complex